MKLDGELFSQTQAKPPNLKKNQHPQKPINTEKQEQEQEQEQEEAIGTNKWYTQLVLAPHGTDPIYPLPYALAFLDGHSILSIRNRQYAPGMVGLGILHSTFKDIVYGPPVCQATDSAVRYYYNPLLVSICLGASELLPSNVLPIVSQWSEFTVKLKLKLSNNDSKSSISFPISRGSAFVTAKYTHLTPSLGSVHTIVSLECINLDEEHHLFGFRKYRIRYNDASTWLIYSLPEKNHAHLHLRQISPTDISHITAWSGIIQIVKMSEYYELHLDPANLHRCHEESTYDRGVGVWIQSATLKTGPVGSGRYSFDWLTSGPRAEYEEALVFALPHHTKTMTDSKIIIKPEITLHSRVTGAMRLCRSNTWSFSEEERVQLLDNYGIKPYVPPNSSVPTYDPLKLDLLNQVMVEELKTDFIAESDLDSYYFSGKKLAKQALQCLTASSILRDHDLASKYVEKTKESFIRFCQNQTKAAPLVYDETWKGIISSGILVSGNRNEDFGNGIYNDHHFHYGYFIYTAAILVYHDPSFLKNSMVYEYVNDLIRDVNNSNHSDPYFPIFRNFDWFLGHSLATGLDTCIDGKNQESCSEDANFFYSVKIWAQVIKDETLKNLVSLQLAILKNSLDFYYFFKEDNDNNHSVVPNKFKDNRVAGILFENKVDYTTFFSNQKDAIHMIQVIPITPITPFLRSAEFVWQEWVHTGGTHLTQDNNQICQISNQLSNGYQTLLLTQFGIVDPNYVFKVLVNKLIYNNGDGEMRRNENGINIIPLDDGISLGWILGFLIHQIHLFSSSSSSH